jgi:hypothetical protein
MGLRSWLGSLVGAIDAPTALAAAERDPTLRLSARFPGPEADAWRALPAAQREAIVQSLSEGMFDGGYADPDANLTASQGGSAYFRRLTASRRDLHPLTQARMLEIASYLYDSNPLAKRVLELTRDYVMGDGITVTAQGDADSDAGTDAGDDARDRVQRAIDAFWHDPWNRLDLKLPGRVLELGMYGEWLAPVVRNPKTGGVRLGYVDPAAIKDVLPVPGSDEEVEAVVLVGRTGLDERRLKVVRVVDDPADEWYGRYRVPDVIMVDGDPDRGRLEDTYQPTDATGNPVGQPRHYDGACLLFQINKVANARRGRSDLLALADWIDAYDQMLFNAVDRSLLLKSFVWDVAMAGSSQEQVDEYSRRPDVRNPPKAGSVRFHNDKVVWSAVTPDLKTVDDAAAADLVGSYVATGAGMAKTWLNGAMDVNRATAGALAEPAIARVSARQRYVRYMVEQLVRVALDSYEQAAMLTRRAADKATLLPPPWGFSVNAPDLRPKDMAAAGQTLAQVVTALAAARADDAVDEETEQEVIAALLGQLGVEVDLMAMRQRIDQAKQERAQQAATDPYRQPRLLKLTGQDDPAEPSGDGRDRPTGSG